MPGGGSGIVGDSGGFFLGLVRNAEVVIKVLDGVEVLASMVGEVGDDSVTSVFAESLANCDSYAYNITKHDKHVN